MPTVFYQLDLLVFIGWILGMSLYIFILYASWRYFKKRGIPDLIVPSFDIPKQLSPAMTRYLYFQKIDHRSFISAIVNLHIQKYLTIEEQDGGYSLTNNYQKAKKSLTEDALLILDTIFENNVHRVMLQQEYHAVLASIYKRFKKKVASTIRKRRWFVPNLWVIIINIMFTFMAYGSSVMILFPSDLIPFSMFLGLSCSLLLIVFWAMYERMQALATFSAVLVYLSTALLHASMDFHWANFFLIIPFLFLFISIPWIYAKHMNILTRKGIQEKVKVLGLYDYLKIAEQDRYNRLDIRIENLTDQESLFPYAIALELETKWSNDFESAIKQAL